MNKKIPIVCFILIGFTLIYLICNPKEQLYEAKWNDTNTLAITIDGEISTTFPSTNTYNATVTCTTGIGSVSWDGSGYVLTINDINNGNSKCNIDFIKTLNKTILASNEVKTPITTPGSEISASNEALLASAEDDDGISYYFRGAVTNNYVEFANKCWKIVRIGGDNTVKLILHNDNTSNISKPCLSANKGWQSAFAHVDDSFGVEFNSNYNDNTYIGFMYGNPGSTTYEETHINTNKSTIYNYLETWYNNYLKNYESVITDNIFCDDKVNIIENNFDPWGYNPNGLGYGTNATIYGATKRLVSSTGIAGGTGPSLKCNGELSKITSKIGLITADELAYAGYAYNISNTTNYLQENVDGAWWWAISPGHFNKQPYIWSIRGGTGSFDFDYVNNRLAVRPVISLVSSTKVSNGSGTSENPYIVSV